MITEDIRTLLKRNNTVFSIYSRLTDSLYQSNYRDYQQQKQTKTKERIRKELKMIREYWKCDPMSYFTYRLFEKDLTEDELLDYIPPYYFYNHYVPSIYNDKIIRQAASKIIMHKYFISKNIPVPPLVATVIKGKIFDAGDELIDFIRFVEILHESDSVRFFMKPDKGQGGKGIYRIEKKGQELLINGKYLGKKHWQEIIRNQDYIIQAGVVQRDDIMRLYPSSVNTLRVITQYFKGVATVPVVELRSGRNGSFVDNASSGGISGCVDPETGTLPEYFLDIKNNRRFDKHPDTGFQFKGFTINGWDEIRNGILEIARKAEDFHDAGWDIAIVNGGLVVIELNLNYGLEIQCVVGGMRPKLNIEPFKTPETV